MSAQPDDTPEQPPYVTPWNRLVGAARQLWSGNLTLAGYRISSLSAGRSPGGYALGWLFVGLQAWPGFGALQGFLRSEPGDWFRYPYLAALAWELILGSAAGLRRPWGWYLLVVAIPAVELLTLIGKIEVVWFAWEFLEPEMWRLRREAPRDVGSLMLAGLWFVYFYRRRATFGARRSWGWLEATLPRVAGPGTFDPQVLGLPWVAWPLLALALALWTRGWLWGS